MTSQLRHRVESILTGVLCAAAWGLAAAAGATAPEGPPAEPRASAPLAKILVESDGVYRVTDAALQAAGVRVPDGEAARLRLRLRQDEVPVRLLTAALPSAAGRFAFDFAGHFPRGAKTYEDEYNRASVYLLDLAPAGTQPARYAAPPAGGPEPAPALSATPLHGHHEVNRKLMRFSGTLVPDETWYWELAMASDPGPKTVTVRVERVDPTRGARLRVRLQGYSSLPQSPDHDCALSWNGSPLAHAQWDGQTAFTFEHDLRPGALREGENRLGFQVDGALGNGIDVVLLDWIEIGYTQRLDLTAASQIGFNADGESPLLLLAPGTPVTVYDTASGRVQAETVGAERRVRVKPAPAGAPPPSSPAPPSVAPAQAAARPGEPPAPATAPPFQLERPRFWAVREGAQWPPAAIRASRNVDLRAGPGADFVVVTHADFLPAAERLAAQRRGEGLAVRVAAVEDIYDQFAHGFLGPEPIREFLRFAFGSWSPRPRYVLLLGDASWDYKNRTVDDADYPDHEFLPSSWNVTVPKIPSTPLKPGDRANDRQRVPTFQWQSPWGHAASDNFYACLDGDDQLPDLAVGRIPAGTVEEAEAAVDKVLAYGRRPDGAFEGALFITDQYQGHQAQADLLARDAQKLGYGITKIYPKPDEKDNQGNSAAIKAAFDSGQSLVVFAGHGGRYIWRTGPPDPQKNHDLFTLQHLEELRPTAELPVVISLTCYSAPFDHPTADSIGEKLLRLRERGAVAVVASSWRNVPPFMLAQHMVGDLGAPDTPRLGDAFVKGMRQVGAADSLHTYNLLGDPSMPFKAPPRPDGDAVQASGATAAPGGDPPAIRP